MLSVLRHDAGHLIEVSAAVVMDDHIHVLMRPLKGQVSSRLLQKWKSISSHTIVKSSPRTSPLWQAEYYLRWLNGPDAIATCAAYIHTNPERRWPGIENYPWIL